MATLRNAWQGIGNIGNPGATIAAETALTNQLANARQEGNKNIADLFTGFAESDAARIAAEAQQQFNTGNPLIDNKARQEYGAEQVGIHSPQQLNALFNTQLTNDQKNLKTESDMFAQVDKMNDSNTVTGQLGATDFNQIGMGDAFNNYRDNLANDVAQQPYEDAILRQVDTQGFNYNTDNSIAAMRDLKLDPSKPESYTSAVKEAALNKSALRIKDVYAQQGGDMPLILAKKVAAKLFAKSPDAVKFQQGTAFESKQTIASIKGDEVRSGLLDASKLDPNDKATYGIKLNAINAAVEHIKKHPKMVKADRESFDQQIGVALEGINIVPGSGAQGRFGEVGAIFSSIFPTDKTAPKEKDVTTGKERPLSQEEQMNRLIRSDKGVGLRHQARFKDLIRKRLKDPKTGFPLLPDRIINAYVDNLVAADPNLGPAFTRGKEYAAEQTRINKEAMLTAGKIRDNENKILQKINIAGGGADVAINDTIDKFREQGIFDNSESSMRGQSKLRAMYEDAYSRVRSSFQYTDKDGNLRDLLDNQGIDAFNLAFHKMAMNKTRIDLDRGLFGINFFDTDDIDVKGKGGDISSRDSRELLSIMLESVPNKRGDRMRTNIRLLNDAISRKRKIEDDPNLETENQRNNRLIKALTPNEFGNTSKTQPYNQWMDPKFLVGTGPNSAIGTAKKYFRSTIP
ncbi:hypothetical protein OAW27_00195 [bacterium]|nr:hypothetical protein [bacterium]